MVTRKMNEVPPSLSFAAKIAVAVFTGLLALGLIVSLPQSTAEKLDKHIAESCVRITKIEDRLGEAEKVNVQLITELKNVNQNVALLNENVKVMNERILLIIQKSP